ncbi:unnamed protein product [Rhizoctonia solani]|uniref:F-box domain-containing protein n=1 Tax=Rhizoctonia solani TaxID=456999 RepID=A0A8H3E0Q9_9AGAM|nr:unnamed protein product [Rhizoctonia solani]
MDLVPANELPQRTEHEANIYRFRVEIAPSVNRRSLVNSMPFDILLLVFQLLVDIEHRLPWSLSRKIPRYPLTLSHVCTIWRRIVLHSPSLWIRIKFQAGPETINLLKGYVDFHSSQASANPMDIVFGYDIIKGAPEAPSSLSLIQQFAGRIRSLLLRLNLFNGITSNGVLDAATSKAQGELITECLRANNGVLERFALSVLTERPQRVFISSASTDIDRNSLNIYLPHDQLENASSHFTDLWLRGVYFNWESKAYHGLTSLRLDPTHCYSDSDRGAISELQLLNLLASSPRLRSLDVGLFVIRAPNTPDLSPVNLPDLEHLVGEILLLRLVLPGSNDLTLSILGLSDDSFDMSSDAVVKEFFLRAHIVNFYSDHFFRNISDICTMLSFVPRLRNLAISHIDLHDATYNGATHSSLDTLYLLGSCAFGRSILGDMVDKWAIKRLVFWGENYIRLVRDMPRPCYITCNQQALEEEPSDMRISNARLEFVPRVWGGVAPVELFVGSPFE